MRQIPKSAEVVIIGGGVIGLGIAYYLAKKGVRDVVLIERKSVGGGSTGKCLGGIRTQFSTRINLEFSLLARTVFDTFESEFGIDPLFNRTGYLFLAGNEQQRELLESGSKLMKSMGVMGELLGPEEIMYRWPFISIHDIICASYTEQDGYAGPHEVLQGFLKGARRLGVKVYEGMEVIDIFTESGAVRAVELSGGEKIVTPAVVNAAGPYAASVARLVGLNLPVRPVRRQIFFTEKFSALPPSIPLILDMEYGWYMRREGESVLLSGPRDAGSSFNEAIDFAGREWTAERSLQRIPVLESAAIAGGWAGLYELSPDHHAVIGPFPDLDGFICANGFSGHGFQHSPAVGMLVAEIIVEGNARTLDVYSLRPSRFREGDLIHEQLNAYAAYGK